MHENTASTVSEKFFLWGGQFESVEVVTFNRRRV